MEPKKNPGADLEGKRGLFFLFGMALTLTAAIFIIQYERGILKPIITDQASTAAIDDPIPVTEWKKERAEPEPEKKLVKPNDLPPEVVPDTKLLISAFIGDAPPEEPIAEIGREDDLGEVETFDFFMLENIARPSECEAVSDKVEQKACFDEWIKSYIATHTRYPELARQMNLQDKVFVTFIISETGEVEEVTIGKGEYNILNEEALRVLSSMPAMTPATQRGNKVKMRMTVPVNFTLRDR